MDSSPPPFDNAGEITGSNSVKISQTSNKVTATNSIDDAIERCMSPSRGGLSHLIFPFFAIFTSIFDGQQIFVNVFSDSQPPWHCTSPSCNNVTTSLSAPCNLPSSSWSPSLPRHISTISDFSLECSSPVLLALPASSFFAGCVIGGLLLATLADSRLGRKRSLVLSSLTMSLAAALTAFSPNLVIYAVLRFACGFARSNVGNSAFVLSSELVPRRHRNHINILSYIFYDIGFLSLPIIAFLNRASSWRLLYLYISIPPFIYSIFLHFFMIESPRWLLVKGRRQEAIETLKKLSSLKETESFSDLPVLSPEETESEGLYSAAMRLWEKRWALRRLGIIMAVSFGIGMMYYGMPLSLGNLNANLYLSVALNAVAEFPSACIAFLLVNKVSRRGSMMGLTIVTGGFSLACMAAWGGSWPEMVLELAAFFGGCTAFNILLIYAMELFPTCVRSSAIAVVRQAVVLGGVAAPALVAAGRRRRFLSFGVFGIVIIVGGGFALLLPETRGRGISDIMEEEEEKMRMGVGNVNP
ncbi:organic cation/carnitine transporter 2-like [Phalaenopsis equestris]|uniref:organic cation/carnitine transporter 2-like n=1 Tax=Phalaenopsis equestris TaxID=78828 RepID=UPI0009E4FEB3|nr:organic cation/carnitine transporter 2-like [Phalaenopsis equestris]